MPDNATYDFLPYARRGYEPEQGSIQVKLTLKADGKVQSDKPAVSLSMTGPGDILGIDARQVIRMDPAPDMTNSPPNYLPVIEFAAPDLPWLFSPVSAEPHHGRALPWLMLLVVERTKQVRLEQNPDQPLPSISVPADELPPPEEAWAWAHVQVAGGLGGAEYTSRSLKTRSRLVAPRNLLPNKPYIAIVVPLFESGRLAGLGKDPAQVSDPTAYAWGTDQQELPVYHAWEFSTGKMGDFEYLVSQLEPRDLSSPDSVIGYRPIDVRNPGPESLEITQREAGTVKLPGALRVPGGEDLTYAKRDGLREILNTPQTVTIRDNEYETVGPPMYGAWHAMKWKLTDEDPGPDRWLYDLNLYPGYRVAAGIGAQIVREKQEQLMESAWDQVGQVRETNRWLKAAQLSHAVTARAFSRLESSSKSAGWRLQFTAPAHSRLLTGGKTSAAHIRESAMSSGLLSAAFRRMASPAGRLARRAAGSFDSAALTEEAARGEIALQDGSPDGLQMIPDSVTETCTDLGDPPDFGLSDVAVATLKTLSEMLEHTFALVDLLMALFPSAEQPQKARQRYGARHAQLSQAHDNFGPELESLASAVDAGCLPDWSPSFSTQLGDAIESAGLPQNRDTGEIDWPSRQKALFTILRILNRVAGCLNVGSDEVYLHKMLCPPAAEPPQAERPDIAGVLDAFDPGAALIARVNSRIDGTDVGDGVNPFDPIMAYPKFPQPMYRDLDEQVLLPGIGEIPKNTVGLLETNPEFIEAFMVGLNHEMAAELQWRRYPTDRRGSYFRQFWDTSRSPDEPEKDIQEIHTWDETSQTSPLGSNMTGGDSEQVVLIVRGELLQRYPNATIYASKARKDTTASGHKDRKPHWADEASTENLRFPVFHAQLDSDVIFLGFELTTAEAKDDPGWFFVFEEAPGDPRFGLDADPTKGPPPAGIRYTPEGGSEKTRAASDPDGVEPGWQGLKWGHIYDGRDPSSVKVIKVETSPPGQQNWHVSSDKTKRRWASDPDRFLPESSIAKWKGNGAHMASILWQRPARVAIHASMMLPKNGDIS